MDSLVDVDWLKAHLNDADLTVLDCTVAFEVGENGVISFFSGRDDWQRAHIPGSGFADIINELADTSSPYQFTLPSAEIFANAMSKLGVEQGRRVVLYDATYTMWATRVWWMLKAFGFDEVAVLNGGLTAWQAAGLAVTDQIDPVSPTQFAASLRPGWFVDSHAVESAISEPQSTQIIDALMPDMYTGKQTPYSRPGHIPGAINIPAVSVVDAETRLFLDHKTLTERFQSILEQSDQAVIAYCGGGIAATADGFLLRLLGKTEVAVYDGSMAEWSADPARPLVTGESAR